MKPLPSRPDLEQLKTQAKELLGALKRGDPAAARRFGISLPAVAGLKLEAIAGLGLRLRDAQSCLAREYGFVSWGDLKSYVDAIRERSGDPAALAMAFCRFAYSGDITGGMNRARPNAAARLLVSHPELQEHDPWLACATGNVALVREELERTPTWLNQSGGPLDLTPLIAATHSGLLRVDNCKAGLHAVVDLLLEAGADPNLRLGRRWAGSAAAAHAEWRVSALHGAAGVNFDPGLTRRLLAAGADPNDGESLYHSLDNPVCTPILLEAGAIVTGTNALYRCLDFDDFETFRLLLSYATGAEEFKGGGLLLWAIRRRRSPAHVEALLAAGSDPAARTPDGVSAYVQALRYGLLGIAAVLSKAGGTEDLAVEDQFIAACAIGDLEAARNIQERRPDLPAALGENRLRMLPELAASGCSEAVRTMVQLDWPIAVRGGDWSASALNHSVFRGDGALTSFLLEHGASWTEEHGFGANAIGTLSWASLNQPEAEGDYLACAEALVDHGMPMASRNPDDPERVIVTGKSMQFSDEVIAFLLGDETGVSR